MSIIEIIYDLALSHGGTQCPATTQFALGSNESGKGRETTLLSLDSPAWSELEHAYGDAADIPALLRRLEEQPSCDAEKEPWFTIWSALAHQGDVYSASFAAVPHIIRMLKTAPLEADTSFFQFPTWVEICRHKNGVKIPDTLEKPYSEALSELPSLVAAVAGREWDAEFLRSALAAIAAAKGFPAVAEAVQEIDPEIATEFMAWLSDR